jgi:hypothetical protein
MSLGEVSSSSKNGFDNSREIPDTKKTLKIPDRLEKKEKSTKYLTIQIKNNLNTGTPQVSFCFNL